MDNRPSLELLEATHQFPGTYRIKAIGSAGGDFVERVVAAASGELAGPEVLTYSVRQSGGGRHAAVTLDMMVQTAEQVRAIYAAIGAVEGLIMLL